MDSGADFADFMWMIEEDVEAFEQEFEQQLLQEEVMWCELQQMLYEEETTGSVYFSDVLFDSPPTEDDGFFEDDRSTEEGIWSLNPEAPAFVPLKA